MGDTKGGTWDLHHQTTARKRTRNVKPLAEPAELETAQNRIPGAILSFPKNTPLVLLHHKTDIFLPVTAVNSFISCYWAVVCCCCQ